MKKIILIFFTIIAFINVQAQCNSNPYLTTGGSGGTVNFADSSTILSGWSTNFSEYSIFKSTKLLKIVDVYGREVTNATNQVLFYIYDNGYVEKKMLSR